jgi:hypothetical protein
MISKTLKVVRFHLVMKKVENLTSLLTMNHSMLVLKLMRMKTQKNSYNNLLVN